MVKPQRVSPVRNLFTAVLAAGALAAALPASAEEADISRWYRIDMVVFANQSSRAENEEKWRRDLSLRYPDNLQALRTEAEYFDELCKPSAAQMPGADQEPAEAHDPFRSWKDTPTTDSDDRQSARQQKTELHPDCLPGADRAPRRGPVAVADPDRPGPSSQRAWQEARVEQPPRPPLPRPFILGEHTDPAVDQAVTRLQRSRNFRPLFRGSWMQPLGSRQQAPALLIRGGEKYGKHYELEGYIRLGLERYLHIDTDLWLSRFVLQNPSAFDDANANPASAPWPQLPIPFVKPAGTQPDDNDLAAQLEVMTDPERDRVAGEESPTEQFSSTADPGDSSLADSRGDRTRQRMAQLQDTRPQYHVERTVVMREQRRMRSNQLHYIDHPLFGVLIRITPLEQISPWKLVLEPSDNLGSARP